MSFAIDLGEYGPQLEAEYEKVISSDPDTTWAVFGYDGSSEALKPQASGSGDLDEFVDAFDDSAIEYGLVRVEFGGINKIVLVGFCGENVSGRKRLVFNSHMAAVVKQFPGHHIQVTALSSEDLTPALILERIASASGSKYNSTGRRAIPTKPKYVKAEEGANEKDWGDSAPVDERDLPEPSSSAYKSSARDELLALRKKTHPAKKDDKKAAEEEDAEEEAKEEAEEEADGNGVAGLDVGTSYKPVGKIDLKKIREEGKKSKFADSRIEKIEPSYKPVGKVDIKAIREHARREKQLKAERQAPEPKPKKSVVAEPEEAEEEEEEEEEVKPSPKRSLPSRKPAEEPKRGAKVEFESEAAESQYKAPDRRAEYGVRKSSSKAASTDSDEPQLGSLADRMKAFQQSVSAAKPQYDTSSTARPSGTRSSASSRVASGTNSVKKDPIERPSRPEPPSVDDDESEETVSVAAQLARARLAAKEQDEEPANGSGLKEARQASYGVKKSVEREEAPKETASPKANVSTFAARFAKKEPKDEAEAPQPKKTPIAEPEEESDAAPAPPRRTPKQPEPEPEEEAVDVDGPVFTVIVTEAYEKDGDDEIELILGETIENVQKADENWWLGSNSKGEFGLFPADYVKVVGDADEPAGDAADDDVKTAIALYSHEPDAGDEDELAFEENETIEVLDFTSDDWWTGKNSKGEVGLFPSTYVKLQ